MGKNKEDYIETDKLTKRVDTTICRQAYMQTVTDRCTEGQTDRWTDRQTYAHTDRH